MANEYQKINTLFLRDENNIIMPDKFTCLEFDYLKDCLWECTEKIDGTNVHIDYLIEYEYPEHQKDENDFYSTWNCEICGRTDKAQLPQHLHRKLASIFSPGLYSDMEDMEEEVDERWNDAFYDTCEKTFKNKQKELRISIYGEGYGMKIQKGGNYIKNDCGFILFDVKVNNWWLSREACEQIAVKMGVPIVPLIGYMTIPEAIEYVKKGFKSTIAENPDYDAEGLVLKTPYGLQFRNGQRIITKIKTCDFQKYRNKYGDGPVEQVPNPNYNK